MGGFAGTRLQRTRREKLGGSLFGVRGGQGPKPLAIGIVTRMGRDRRRSRKLGAQPKACRARRGSPVATTTLLRRLVGVTTFVPQASRDRAITRMECDRQRGLKLGRPLCML